MINSKSNVIDQGLCTHCGSCVGLSDGNLDLLIMVMGLFQYIQKIK